MNARRDAGFTLLELIVAAGILALVAVFSWRGLDTLVREREAIALSQATIDVVQRSFARIERDAILANDAQLDEDGVLRLTTGAAPTAESPAATVEYRLVSGALTRSVAGVDRAPLVLLDNVASLSMEAWLPVPGGGSWVKTKGAATEAPRAPAAGAAAATSASAASATPPGGGTPFRSSNAPDVPGVARGSQRGGAAQVAAATGVRLSFAGADGARVTRSFMIGGS